MSGESRRQLARHSPNRTACQLRGMRPSVYAHVATGLPQQAGGRTLVLLHVQRLDTEKHESDWEMVRLTSTRQTPAQALLKGPYEVDQSQHAGGERSSWTDTKLEKQG